MNERFVVVGAGPAGIAAAEVLAAAGVAVTLIDEGAAPGGQGFRKLGDVALQNAGRLLGSSGKRDYDRFHARADAVVEKIDYRPGTVVWHIFDKTLSLGTPVGLDTIDYTALILATGATDRIMPVKGWTRPGVYSLGAAQTLLKRHFAAIGRKTVFCGSSPLLYLIAAQYVQAGAEVAAVLDTTPLSDKIQALGELAARPSLLIKGLSYRNSVKRAGAAIHDGVTLEAVEGAPSAVLWRDRHGKQHRTDCDGVAFGHGLRPETQLAEIAEAEMVFDAASRNWLPSTDAAGRVADGVYAAGDGARIRGAEAALISGALAAHTALADAGKDSGDTTRLAAQLKSHDRFQAGLRKAFSWPSPQAAARIADDTVVCRCENITAGALRVEIRSRRSEADPNRVKALSRCGMGRCQGRFCGSAAIEIIAAETGADAVPGRLRAQPPAKPIPVYPLSSEDAS